MEPKILGYVEEEQGCGPQTDVYRDAAASIRKLEGASLKVLMQDGDPNLSLSEQQAQEAAASLATEPGGILAGRKVSQGGIIYPNWNLIQISPDLVLARKDVCMY